MNKDNVIRAWFIVGVCVLLFLIYMTNTYEKPKVVITEIDLVVEKEITVDELSKSPFMDHTNDIENYASKKFINFGDPVSSKDSINFEDILLTMS